MSGATAMSRALALERMLEKKLADWGRPLSLPGIAEALQSAILVPVPDIKAGVQLWNVGAGDSIDRACRGTGSGSPCSPAQGLDDVDALTRDSLARRSDEPDDLDALILAVGLRPLPVRSTLDQVKQLLGMTTLKRDVLLALSLPARLGLVARTISDTAIPDPWATPDGPAPPATEESDAPEA